MEKNYKIEYIEFDGEKLTVKVPLDEVYKDAEYHETQAAKTILFNLTGTLQQKLSLSNIETLINLQGEYIQNQQETNPNFIEMDAANVTFLQEKLLSFNIHLSSEEIFEIFEQEVLYLKLINLVE